MKIKCRFHQNFIALFSNANSENKNDFYLLMVYHKSKKGGFEETITNLECKVLIANYNKHNGTLFNYKEFK